LGKAVPNSGIINLGIGLAFVFGVTAALSSVVTELISRFLGLRGAYLLRGLRELLDDDAQDAPVTALASATADYATLKTLLLPPAQRPADPAGGREPPKPSATGALLGSPILRSQGMTSQISSRQLTLQSARQPGRPATLKASGGARQASQRRSLPSYIPARSFAEAVIDLLVPDAADQTTMSTVEQSISALPDWLPTLKSSLQALAKNAGNDIDQFRTSVENWYDDHMDRVSGWYKRYVAKITLVVGAILVLLLNVNTLTIGRTLYTDSTISTAVSSVAAKTTSCPAGQSQQACLTNLEAQLSSAATAGLPIGWATVRDCATPRTRCNWLDQRGILSPSGGSGWQLAVVLIGFLLTIAALVPGARFWFGLLSKLGSLSTAGPKPAS
jgi:hypothetical protein